MMAALFAFMPSSTAWSATGSDSFAIASASCCVRLMLLALRVPIRLTAELVTSASRAIYATASVTAC